MLYKTVVFALAAVLVALAVSSKAHAWGAYHAGYTHVGPGGVYHVGGTEAYGRYGGYRYGGAYHYGGYGGEYRYGGYRYGGGYGGEYHYGGYHYGGYPYGGYEAGYYRRW